MISCVINLEKDSANNVYQKYIYVNNQAYHYNYSNSSGCCLCEYSTHVLLFPILIIHLALKVLRKLDLILALITVNRITFLYRHAIMCHCQYVVDLTPQE